LDQGETLKAEIRALRETARTGEELNAEIARLNRDLRTSKLAQDALTSKMRRSASEIKRLTDKERTMETRLKTYENKERLERDVSANAASEREMLKRLEGNDPKLAMETLVRNLVAKNKQMTSQQEAYHALAKQIREKEKEINALEQKVRAYKSRATSTTVNVAEPAPAPEMTTTNKKTVGGKEWEDPVLDSITGSKKPRFAAAKSLRSSGKDGWIREMAAASSRSAKTKTKGPKADSTINLAEEEEEDDVLADILNDVDVRMDRKRRAAAAGADAASTGGALKKRPAGSFLISSPKAPTSTGTFIRHGADGRGGRGKFFVER
jgi:chromosome segregation ATPase